jgi:16S rRNA (guanine966-N2)-methyltransferase
MIKIVGGVYRSRLLETPSSLTMPTKSIVRTAIANALSSDIPNSIALDLFAGSGALGIEALSRGALACFFVDNSPEAAATIRRNLVSLKEDKGTVVQVDYEIALESFAHEHRVFDIVFLDPPYRDKKLYLDIPAALLKEGLLSPRAVIILEYEEQIEAPVSLFSSARTYNYGRTNVLILRR